eukprot:4752398-Amphidinium_carterae.2
MQRTERRINGGHCSYFHRWMQRPIWRLSQAKFGNGPYTLCKEHHEPATAVWKDINVNSIPDLPSRNAYTKYRVIVDKVGYSCQHPRWNAKTAWGTSSQFGLEQVSCQTRFQVRHGTRAKYVRMDRRIGDARSAWNTTPGECDHLLRSDRHRSIWKDDSATPVERITIINSFTFGLREKNGHFDQL